MNDWNEGKKRKGNLNKQKSKPGKKGERNHKIETKNK